MDGILLALIFSISLNLAMFFPAFFLRTDKLTDISYALTFAAIAIFLLYRSESIANKYLISLLVFIWAARLGAYLLIRITKIKKDERFDNFRHKFFSFMGFWLLQGITSFIILIPSIFYFESNTSKIYLIGVLVWLAGICIESAADYQKFKFILNKNNKNKWIESGIWHYSRHPNYFGEILCWLGIWIAVLPSLTLWQRILSAISPIFISVMLIFVSGIPLLEKKADERWGHDHRYENYKRRTSILILWPVTKKQKNK